MLRYVVFILFLFSNIIISQTNIIKGTVPFFVALGSTSPLVEVSISSRIIFCCGNADVHCRLSCFFLPISKLCRWYMTSLHVIAGLWRWVSVACAWYLGGTAADACWHPRLARAARSDALPAWNHCHGDTTDRWRLLQVTLVFSVTIGAG